LLCPLQAQTSPYVRFRITVGAAKKGSAKQPTQVAVAV
jgi:hypothetical protein